MRKGFDKGSPLEATMLDAWDAIWGARAAGDIQYPVGPEMASLPRMRRKVLRTIVSNPGISIYDLAKRLSRNYSRVLKDVRLLAEMGEVEMRPDPQSRRKAKRLVPVRSINTMLAGISLQRASCDRETSFPPRPLHV